MSYYKFCLPSPNIPNTATFRTVEPNSDVPAAMTMSGDKLIVFNVPYIQLNQFPLVSVLPPTYDI